MAVLLAGDTSTIRSPFSRAVSRVTAPISSNGSTAQKELLELALLDSIPQSSRTESAGGEPLNLFTEEETAELKVIDDAFADWYEFP